MRAAAVKRVVNPTSMRTTLGTTARYPMPIAQATPMPDISRNIRVGSSENRYRLIGGTDEQPGDRDGALHRPEAPRSAASNPNSSSRYSGMRSDDEYASEQERDRVQEPHRVHRAAAEIARRGSRRVVVEVGT